jgi:tetratricopeptide (TPR) repeat protein
MRKIVCLLICSLLLIAYPIPSLADPKTFIEEYNFPLSEYDYPLSSRTMALVNVRKPLLEKVIIYLDSNSDIKDLHLDKDIVSALAAVAFRPEIISERSYGGAYYIKARITADDEQFLQYYKALQSEQNKMQELVLLKKWLDKAFIEAEKRKKELDATPILNRQGKIGPYTQVIKQLSTADDFTRGYSYALFGKHREAINAFTRVVDLNPNNSAAYYNRGLSYLSLKNKQLAMQDFESCMKGVVVDTKSIIGYRDPKSLISENEDPGEIIRKMSKAVDMKPDDADAFYNRGTAYLVIGMFSKAISDFSRAIDIRPQEFDYYYNRKVAWQRSLDSDKFTVEAPPSMAELVRRRVNAIQEAGEQAKKRQDESEARQRRTELEQQEMRQKIVEMERERLDIEKKRMDLEKRRAVQAVNNDERRRIVDEERRVIDPETGRIYRTFR